VYQSFIMRTRDIIVSAVAIIVVVAACKKSTYNTKPTITLKQVSTNEVIPAQPLDQTPPLVITLEYTDAEGDLAGGRVGVQKIVPNCPSSEFIDTLSYTIADNLPRTKNQKALLDIVLPYISINPICNFNDSAEFKVWVVDQGGNVSDTVNTGQIVIRKP
jgi:hypothetical protein